MKRIGNNIYFYLPYIIILAFTSFFLVTESKADIHKFLNQFHITFLDYFFRYITFLGSGLFILLVCAFLLLISFRTTLILITTYISTGIFVQVLKRTIFDDVVRPALYFKGNFDLYLVEGVKIYNKFSFPSGHAATTFGFFICFALISRNKLVKILSLLLACLVGYSRIYLSQHFLIDIYFGSIIGVTGGIIFYNIIYHENAKWLDNSLLTLKWKKDED